MKTLTVRPSYWFLLVLLLITGLSTGCGGSSDPPIQNPEAGNPPAENEEDNSDRDEPTVLTCDNPNYQTAMNLRIYQVMTEAFVDGDPGIGYGDGYGTSHHSGDLRGIIKSLEYIKSLGFNAIWLTPVFDSVALPDQDLAADRLDATGYYASNYFAIDPNFGTLDDARELVDTAHELGLYVFFDGVFGHFKNNAESYPSPEGASVSTTGESEASTGRLAEYPEDLAFFKTVATYWIRELKIDGWRLDQAYQVPLDAWVEIRRAVEDASAEVTYVNAEGRTVNPLGYMVAEIWKSESDIAAEAYGPEDRPALCSAFDFPMRYALVQTLAVEESGTANPVAARLRAGFNTREHYPAHAIPNGFLGNHDLVRFGDLLQRGGIAEPDEDAYWARHKAAFSFLAAYSGPVTLYYGEEIGQEVPGYDEAVTANCADQGLCDDHVARTSGLVEGLPRAAGEPAFVANDAQADLRDYLSELMHLRAEHPALYRGERSAITLPAEVASALYADYKRYEDDVMIYWLNVTDQPVTTVVSACALGSEGTLTDALSGEVIEPADGQYELQVPATTGVFMRVNEPSSEGPACDSDAEPVQPEGPLADCGLPGVDGDGPLGSAMFIRGSYTGGDNFAATPADRAFSYKGDDLYQVIVSENEASTYGFKFASDDWRYEFAVAGSAEVRIGEEQPMAVASGPGTESYLSVPEAGDYVFSFRVNSSLDGGEMMVSQCP